MDKLIQANQCQFERDGFAFVHDVLSAAEIEIFAPIFSERLPADKLPPGIPDAGLNGRKTLISEHTDPRLSNLAGHRHLIEAVDTLIGPRFLIQSTSAPVITYKSPPGAERFDLGYHVDWPNNPPKPHDDRHLNCALHFSTVETGGGALMICPGSHRLVEKSLEDPELRKRMLDQNFNGFPGLPEPVEVCVPAGTAVFFHSFLVHDRSENILAVPRRVLFTHYKGFDDTQLRHEWAAKATERFVQHQIDTMDERLLHLCGLDEKQ